MNNRQFEQCDCCHGRISEGEYLYGSYCAACFRDHLDEHLAATAVALGLPVYINTVGGKVDCTGGLRGCLQTTAT